jgi:hypothetical protein
MRKINKKSLCCLAWVVLSIISVILPSVQTTMAFGLGIHMVGTDIEPGIYRTTGEITYFARLSGLTGEFSDIISNEAYPQPPVLVEIKLTDVAFESMGSGEWTIIDGTYNPEPITSFSGGWWFVGIDIIPGLYRTEDTVNYFERLSGLGAELQDIIANSIPSQGPVVVEIKADDLAFHSTTDGLWSIVDESYKPQVRTTIGDGYWIVNLDILPGIYRTEDDVQYYARLSGFGNEFQDIISNATSVSGGATIEILESDVGFLTKGGAQWSRLETEPNANLVHSILLLLLDE